MITLLLPLASSDRLHAPHFLRLMQAFPPGPDTKALILPTPSAFHDPALSPIIDSLRELFQPENVRVETTQNDFGQNWSYNSACHFRHAMDTLYSLGEGWADRPAVWMEADLQPIVPNWDKLIDDDYRLAGTPFRGMLEKTRYIDQAYEIDPKTKAQKLVGPRTPRYDGSIHLVGAGMYPPNYVSYLGPNKSPMASYRSPSPNIPFDVKCQDQHKPATQSPLFLHKPRTVNWRRTEGNLFRCDDQTKDEFGLSYSGAVNLSGVALVHGCKDGSLADAILQNQHTTKMHVMSISQDGQARVSEEEIVLPSGARVAEDWKPATDDIQPELLPQKIEEQSETIKSFDQMAVINMMREQIEVAQEESATFQVQCRKVQAMNDQLTMELSEKMHTINTLQKQLESLVTPSTEDTTATVPKSGKPAPKGKPKPRLQTA